MTEKRIADLLSSTAFWTASVRALESGREDRLFNDPWADILAGQVGAAWIRQRSKASVLPIVLRTRYFGDFLQQTAANENIKQVVFMAAGLDTRAYRLEWPEGTRIYELDQSTVFDHKEQVLKSAGAAPACTRQAIGIDLTGHWEDALVMTGFNPQTESIWLLEGFLFYLPKEAITRIIKRVDNLSAPGSWMGFDIINSITLTHPLTKGWADMQAASGAPWIGTMDDPIRFLADRGWEAYLSQAGADDANHDRWSLPVIPVEMPNIPHNWYVTAKKR